METERKQSEDERGASANQPSRDDERRVSGRAEVTVRCENSFESSPRLIAEEGRSSTGSLCCSPFFPSCFCCHSRKVPTAIAIAVPSNASSYFHVFPRISAYLHEPRCLPSALPKFFVKSVDSQSGSARVSQSWSFERRTFQIY